VAAAYVIIGWLVMQIGEVMAPALHLPDWTLSALAFFVILGFPFALFFAWAFEMTPEGIRKEKEVDRNQSITPVTGRKLDFTIIALLLLALGYFAWDKFIKSPEPAAEVTEQQAQTSEATSKTPNIDTNRPEANSIAVLPFVNMSSDPEQEFFSDGITEEMLNLLAKIPELRVTSRSSVFSFKGQAIDIPTVAKKLGVAHVLEGSVRKSGNQVRITAQLIEAGSDIHMWSETYDRELDDVFAIQDEIAAEVVSALRLQLLGEVPEATETNTLAYTAYLQGKHHLEGARTIKPLLAIESFREAIEIDPEYAPAWAGLAQSLDWAANWGNIDATEGFEQAREAAIKALELDEDLAEAWTMLAKIQYAYDWDWYTAQGTIRTALMHEPKNSKALMNASAIEKAVGNFDEAVLLAQRAVDSDPLNPVVLRFLALAYWGAGRYEETNETTLRILDLYPQRFLANNDVAWSYLNLDRPEEALQYVEFEEKYHPDETRMPQLARAFIMHSLGRDEESRQSLDYTIENSGQWLAYQVAEVYAWRGETDKAFEWLEISYDQRDGGVSHLLGDPSFKPLHNDPRWEPYLLKLGLLKGWQNAKVHWEERP
jgi:adenylate cyclase